MKPHLTIFLLTLLLWQSGSVLAQVKDSASTKSKTRQAVDSTANVQKKKAKEGVKSEVKEVKDIAKEVKKAKPDSARRQEIKRNTKETSSQILDEKANSLQYDSDNPDDAPWKKEQLSKDDLKKFNLPSKGNVNANGLNEKAGEYKNKAGNAKAISADDANLKGKSGKLDNARNQTDSLLALKDRLDTSDPGSLVKQSYSDEYVGMMRDSLGVSKADSLLGIIQPLAQVTSKEDLISKLNAPLGEKTGKAGVGFDAENQSLTSADADKLQGIQGQFSSLDKLELPQEVLSELAPLKGQVMDSKYMPYIDSMRQVYLKAKGFKLDEKHLTDELKKTAMQNKPSFLDKVNFELVLGIAQDSAFTIFQISPAWAYHFTKWLSLGAGPNISVQYHEKKINGLLGVRTFIKGEFWKQRAYLQVEDNMSATKINQESLRRTPHSILAGGGVVLPFSRRYGANLALFYRVNQEQVRPGASPWVVRVGLSSIKNTAKK